MPLQGHAPGRSGWKRLQANRLRGKPGAFPAPRTRPARGGCSLRLLNAPARHVDLHAIAQACRQVDRLQIGALFRAARALNGIVNAGSFREGVETGLAHAADDVDNDRRAVGDGRDRDLLARHESRGGHFRFGGGRGGYHGEGRRGHGETAAQERTSACEEQDTKERNGSIDLGTRWW